MARKKEDTKKDETNIITTQKVDEILEREKLALPLKRTEKLWFNSNDGVRKKGIKFAMIPSELEEYIKCKLSVYYFAENYCKIKLENGSVGQMHLRNYQKDIIKLYTENRYSILMASRQVGKCLTFNALVNITDKNGRIFRVNLGKIYYENIRKYRKLTFIEKIKIFLYNLLEKID